MSLTWIYIATLSHDTIHVFNIKVVIAFTSMLMQYNILKWWYIKFLYIKLSYFIVYYCPPPIINSLIRKWVTQIFDITKQVILSWLKLRPLQFNVGTQANKSVTYFALFINRYRFCPTLDCVWVSGIKFQWTLNVHVFSHFEMLRFRDIGYRDNRLLSRMMKPGGTLLVVLKALTCTFV